MFNPYELTPLHFDQLPESVKSKFISNGKFVDYVGYNENETFKTYFVKEGYELFGYSIIKNNEREKAHLSVKLPYAWIPHLLEMPNVFDEINFKLECYKERKKNE